MKRRKRIWIWLALVVVVAPLAAYGSVVFGDRASMEMDIQEQMLLMLLEENNALNKRADLEVEGGPAPPALLARIQKRFPLAETGQDLSIDGEGSLVYAGTTDAAVTYEVDGLEWLTPWCVQIRAGYYCGLLCASHTTYTLMCTFGRWRVVSTGGTVVS